MTQTTPPRLARNAAAGGIRWMAVTVLVASAAFTLTVSAQEGPGPGMGMPPGHGMMMFDGGEHMAHRLDHMLDGLNATDAQRAQIRQIAQAAANDLKAQHEQARELRHRALQVFGAPTVDAAAAESLRQQMVAQHDQASKRVLQATLEASKVLTPEQRAKLVARLNEREAIMKERAERMRHEHPSQ